MPQEEAGITGCSSHRLIGRLGVLDTDQAGFGVYIQQDKARTDVVESNC